MRNAGTIASRELKAYFASPVAYAVGFFFVPILSAWFYFISILGNHDPTMTGVFKLLGNLCVPVAAVITMHLFSEERRSGTIELLMTYPLNDWEVVLGKFLASLSLYAFVLALTIQYPIFLALSENPIGARF